MGVSLTPAAAARDHATGRFCFTRRELATPGQAVQLLIGGATHAGGHWQFASGGQAGRDYAVRTAAGGVPVLALNAVRTGTRGGRPASLTLREAAYVVHEVAAGLLLGTVDHHQFSKVTLVGRGIAAVLVMAEEDIYDGADIIMIDATPQTLQMGRGDKSPTLIILGQRDRQLCGRRVHGSVFSCASADRIRAEARRWYPARAHLQACDIPGAGQALSLTSNNVIADTLSFSRQTVASAVSAGAWKLPAHCS